MKKKTKILFISFISIMVVITAMMIVLLNNKSYTDNYSSTDLYYEVVNSFSTDGGTNVLDDDVIYEFTDEELSYIKDYTVVKAKNAKNIN